MTDKLTKDQLGKLEERIRTLVPELMELSFGCEIYSDEYGKGVIFFVNDNNCAAYHTKKQGTQHFFGMTPWASEFDKEKDNGKILGHPITLEHCRVALHRNESYWVRDSVQKYWQDLKPWEDQHEVHKFLFNYLLS